MERITALIELEHAPPATATPASVRALAFLSGILAVIHIVGFGSWLKSSGRFHPADFGSLHITTFPADTLGHHQGEVTVKVGGRSVAAHPRHIDAL